MGKRLAAAGMAAAIGVGGLTVAALNPLGIAGAQETPTTEAPAAPGGPGRHDGPLKRALESLVADGTLTQEQADAVLATTKVEAEAGQAKRQERRGATLQVVADALGSTPDEVKAALQGGTSFAAQAEAAGVDRQVLDDALTAHVTAGIDDAVAAGTITEEQATKAKSRLDTLVDRILDADGSRLGRGGFGRRGGGSFGD